MLLLFGCTGNVSLTPDDTAPGPGHSGDTSGETATMEEDADGDGAMDTEDCDDHNPEIHPGAEERCDGVDNDCDGVADGSDAVDADDWYGDEDGDGWGAGVVVRSCWQPAGCVRLDGDCDDGDPEVNPAAVESCDGTDSNCSGGEDDAVDPSTWYPDGDGDGWGAALVACDAPGEPEGDPGDCDDTSASVHPGAIETCDGLDEDCDGEIDEQAVDASRWYADTDADGRGDAAVFAESCSAPTGYVSDDQDCDDANAAVTVRSWYEDLDGDDFGVAYASGCEQPEGWVSNGGDCDDADAGVHPGATEDCTSATDVNCDGSVGTTDLDGDGTPACEDCDDGDASLAVVSAWYADVDADAYGDAGTSIEACFPPTWFVADATDCDDTRADVHPGAAEQWYDDVDEACDGGDDWDADGDGYLLADDCDDTDAAVSPAATEVCNNGADDDCDEDPEQCLRTGSTYVEDGDAVYRGDADDAGVGSSLSGFPDPTSYGGRGLVLGGTSDDVNRGCVWLVRDPVAGEYRVDEMDSLWSGEAEGDYAGFAVESPGDLDGDGEEDVAIGAPFEGSGGTGAGAVYLVSGASVGFQGLGDAPTKILGAANDSLGVSLEATGDYDQDGYPDLLIGGEGDSEGGATAGAVFLLPGPLSGSVSATSSLVKLVGEDAGDYAGHEVASADVDGDGLSDLVVGTWSNAPGAAYVVEGAPTGHVDLSDADIVVRGVDSEECMGWSVDAGDVDGDGYADLLIGAIGDTSGGYFAGAAHLYLGPTAGELTSADAAWTTRGDADLQQVGWSVALAGDVNGDGALDVLVGALYGDSLGPGGAALTYGAPSGTSAFADADLLIGGTQALDYAGTSLAGAGDVNGDGLDEFLVGADGFDGTWSGEGMASLFFGSGI